MPPAAPNTANNTLWKIIGGLFAVLLACGVILVVAGLTKFDSYVMKQTIVGKVTTVTGVAIANAEVTLDDQKASTDPAGGFSFANLEPRKYSLSVNAGGYEPYTKEIDLSSGFLTYTQILNITLQTPTKAAIKGKFTTTQPGYQFLDDRIIFGDKEYHLNTDGSFAINIEGSANYILFRSTNFVDVKKDVSLTANAEEINLGTTELVPAGDIVGSITSYVSQTPVINLSITAEGVSQDQITIDKTLNQFRIQDLQVGKQYQVRLSHPNYLTRDYTQIVNQGESALFGAKIVEKGRYAYLYKGEKDIYVQVYSSNWDGSEVKSLTTDRTDPYGEYVDAEGVVYFMSTRDNVQSTLGGKALLAYAVPADGSGNAQKINTNAAGLGSVFPNFKSKVLINVTTTKADKSDRVIESMDLTGNNRVKLFSLAKGQIYNLAIGFNGTAITFGVKSAGAEHDGLYWVDLVTKEVKQLLTTSPLQVFGLSDSGNLVLFSQVRDGSLKELHVFDVKASSDRRIRSTFTGAQYQFVRGHEDKLVFFDQRNGASNVYSLRLEDTGDVALTSFSGIEAVDAVFQQNGFVIYHTNKGVYALNFNSPHSGKLVTTKFTRYTGYDF